MSMRNGRIDNRVKGILVRRAVDLRYVNFSTIKGTVYISGWLVYDRTLRPLSSIEIFNIEKEIKCIPDVEGVNFRLSAERLSVERPKPVTQEEKKQPRRSYKVELKTPEQKT